jgi:hypothetical protein
VRSRATMPFDLSHPRRILPFPRRRDETDLTTPAAETRGGGGGLPASHQGQGGGQRAIQLKLTREIYAQLIELAKRKGFKGGGKLQLDLRNGKQPVESLSHTLSPHSAGCEGG